MEGGEWQLIYPLLCRPGDVDQDPRVEVVEGHGVVSMVGDPGLLDRQDRGS